jgi:predicted RNA-binding protein Jag
MSKIKIVEDSWKDLKLPFFSSYERKKIHSIVSEYWNPKIYTKSIWELRERRLFICRIDEKITIDPDWNDI